MPATEIDVVPATRQDDAFDVTLRDGGSKRRYQVLWDEWGRRTAAVHDCTREGLVEACFRFLLDREPKESILPRFALGVISRYFPEIDDRIDDYLR